MATKAAPKAAKTEAEAAAEERAAIRAAAPLYVAPRKRTEAEAEALAAKLAAEERAYDAREVLAGQIVQTGTAEAEARAARAAEARAALPARAIEWHPAPVHVPTEAELKAAEAERRWNASIARRLAEAERAEARAAAARQARRNAVVHSAEVAMAELASDPAKLAAAARKARATRTLAEAEARKAYLKETGLTEAEARADELLAAELEMVQGWAAADAVPSRRAKKDAGMASALSPAQLAEVQRWTEAGLSTPAARAGRQALDAIGPTASAVVTTTRKGKKVTIAEVRKAPKVETAEARAARADKALAEARKALAEAETKVTAAEAEKAVQPIRKANTAADRLAAIVRTKAARAEAAAATLTEARKLAALPVTQDGWVAVPVESFKLAEAGMAAEVQLRARVDRMPGKYAHRGPQAKGPRYLTDNTAKLALAELDRLTEEEMRAYWDETWRMVREILAAKKAAEAAKKAAAKQASTAARKAYKAAHERGRRAKQHSKR